MGPARASQTSPPLSAARPCPAWTTSPSPTQTQTQAAITLAQQRQQHQQLQTQQQQLQQQQHPIQLPLPTVQPPVVLPALANISPNAQMCSQARLRSVALSMRCRIQSQ